MNMSYYNKKIEKEVLNPPDQKQMLIWYKKLNLYRFEDLSKKKNVMFEAFNGWWAD